ncbi:hypothetical protein ACOME3_001268 [Neoechinorhynchus agilis]
MNCGRYYQMAFSLNFVRSWKLEKMSKAIEVDESDNSSNSNWQTIDSTKNQMIHLKLNPVLHLTLVKNDFEILATFDLWNSEPYLRCLFDDDCILIVQRSTNSSGNKVMTRKIRAKFLPQNHLTSSEVCRQFVRFISDFMPVCTRSEYSETESEDERYTRFTIDHDQLIDQCIASCLSDPDFPQFVLRVENALNSLSSKN